MSWSVYTVIKLSYKLCHMTEFFFTQNKIKTIVLKCTSGGFNVMVILFKIAKDAF